MQDWWKATFPQGRQTQQLLMPMDTLFQLHMAKKEQGFRCFSSWYRELGYNWRLRRAISAILSGDLF